MDADRHRRRSAPDGTFLARWRTDEIGSFAVRALIAGTQVQAADAAPLTTSVTVYRPARATWFGPGFYGKHTACGQVMSHALLGVAHRTLPCGTPVSVFFAGKSITVPVIDRGPFANGARYDLTSAIAQAVGMTETSMIGVVPQRGAFMDPPRPRAAALRGHRRRDADADADAVGPKGSPRGVSGAARRLLPHRGKEGRRPERARLRRSARATRRRCPARSPCALRACLATPSAGGPRGWRS